MYGQIKDLENSCCFMGTEQRTETFVYFRHLSIFFSSCVISVHAFKNCLLFYAFRAYIRNNHWGCTIWYYVIFQGSVW